MSIPEPKTKLPHMMTNIEKERESIFLQAAETTNSKIQLKPAEVASNVVMPREWMDRHISVWADEDKDYEEFWIEVERLEKEIKEKEDENQSI